MAERLRYVFEDPHQAALREDISYTDILTEQHLMGAYWREQWGQPLALDAMVLRLVVEGEPPHEPDVTVELDFDSDWTAVHRLVRARGTWVGTGEPSFRPRRKGLSAEPTARAKRRANIDRHRHRIDKLIRSAVALDDAFSDGGRLWKVIAYDWQITAPRSRRGRKAELDADRIDRLMSGGKTATEIAAMYGVHEKTPFNVLNRARKRRI